MLFIAIEGGPTVATMLTENKDKQKTQMANWQKLEDATPFSENLFVNCDFFSALSCTFYENY